MRLQDKRKGPRAFRCADVKVSPFIRIGEDLKSSALPRGVHLFRDTYGIIAITNRTKEFVGGISRWQKYLRSCLTLIMQPTLDHHGDKARKHSSYRSYW
jgi:hypothetical protein